MPFKSKSQLGQCYSQQFKNHQVGSWDCDEFLSKTSNPRCLPYKLNEFEKRVNRCKTLAPKDRKVSGVHFGPRGGAYVIAGGVKVYIPKGSKGGVTHVDWVIKKYGQA